MSLLISIVFLQHRESNQRFVMDREALPSDREYSGGKPILAVPTPAVFKVWLWFSTVQLLASDYTCYELLVCGFGRQYHDILEFVATTRSPPTCMYALYIMCSLCQCDRLE